jgi:hypothetical protein
VTLLRGWNNEELNIISLLKNNYLD